MSAPELDTPAAPTARRYPCSDCGSPTGRTSTRPDSLCIREEFIDTVMEVRSVSVRLSGFWHLPEDRVGLVRAMTHLNEYAHRLYREMDEHERRGLTDLLGTGTLRQLRMH